MKIVSHKDDNTDIIARILDNFWMFGARMLITFTPKFTRGILNREFDGITHVDLKSAIFTNGYDDMELQFEEIISIETVN